MQFIEILDMIWYYGSSEIIFSALYDCLFLLFSHDIFLIM